MPSHRRLVLALAVAACGCSQLVIDRTDRQVYEAIEDRQRTALGRTSDVHIGEDSGRIDRSGQMYSFTPHPVHDGTAPTGSAEAVAVDAIASPAAAPAAPMSEPPTKVAPPQPVAPEAAAGSTEAETSDSAPAQESEASAETVEPADGMGVARRLAGLAVPADRVFGLQQTLAYAVRHAREYQNAKEDLYLAALDLTLERHLWTPQFVASVQTQFADYGQVRDFDRAMSAVADLAATQRLPFGGEVTARVVNSLMRDLGVHTTSGESGNFILEAELPLLRGAGRSAYESRYQAERDLIYAVRDFETFRRAFLVQVASDYFELQQLKASISNAQRSYGSRKADWEKADFVNRMGQSRTIFDAPRARSSLRSAESALVSAIEQYQSTLDRFKISINMPVDEPLDVVSQEDDKESAALESMAPSFDELTAVRLALHYRLDLVNTVDALDDARRGAIVSKNRMLPDLGVSGSASMDTDPAQLNSTSYNTERVTWRGFITLQMDDRKTERNAYRASLIRVRRAEREWDRFQDVVRADVRRSLRRISQQRDLRQIQVMNVEENEVRSAAAKAQFDLNKTTNQDRVDAENDLLDARNDYARAVAQFRIAVLEFRRDSGTLRVDDEGRWSVVDADSKQPQ